jgi:dipeptidyl aminopeptidase/acylaminoacyl peptidase
LDVHDGPWKRDHFGYNGTHQWLANRGYAVLSVNYRGSLGFGKDFVEAGTKEFGSKMQDDLIDAIDWAIATKVTSTDSIAIMGGGYGGYAAMNGLTDTPDRFACGVNIMGSSNLITLIESFPEQYEPILEATWYRRAGDPRTEEGRALLQERSPLFKADQIQKPLLLVHGAMNEQNERAESDAIVAAMEENGVPITYLFYEEEDRGFRSRANVQSWRAVTEVFLADCLGGEFEPINGSFKGANVQVLAGAEHIEGLSEAIEEANAQ